METKNLLNILVSVNGFNSTNLIAFFDFSYSCTSNDVVVVYQMPYVWLTSMIKSRQNIIQRE